LTDPLKWLADGQFNQLCSAHQGVDNGLLLVQKQWGVL
jgi:hypothetical protein